MVDLCGNIKTFGKVEDLRIEQPEKGKMDDKDKRETINQCNTIDYVCDKRTDTK